MSQSTLHAYLQFSTGTPSSRNAGSFLDLPYKVRHRIYVLAGLVRQCPIDLNREGEGNAETEEKLSCRSPARGRCHYLDLKSHYLHQYPPNLSNRWCEDNIDCVCLPLPVQLLYVSRSISKECSHTLYSENKFKICRSGHGGFLPLYRMPGTTLASITSLSIRINACPCRPRHSSKDERTCSYHHSCRGGSDKPLNKISRNDKSAIHDWKSISARISSNIRPFYLRLFVICDNANYDVATDIIEPLLNMPILSACSIRLGQAPNHEFCRLAQNTVGKVTGQISCIKTPATHSLHLPIEIQEQILCYTELIATQPLEWEPTHGFVLGYCCGRCTDALEVCCCLTQHAAFAKECSCWRFPTELFLLSRGLSEVATKIFYQRNHFRIFCFGGKDASRTDTLPSLVQFLTSIPSYALEHLRFIDCVFPPLSSNFHFSDGPANTHWLDAIIFLDNHVQLSNLTLTLDMSCDRGSSSDMAYMPSQQILETEDAMWRIYQRIAEPLRGRGGFRTGLANLFVHLSWPLDNAKARVRDEQEKTLEKRIMGEGYNAVSQGKFAKDI